MTENGKNSPERKSIPFGLTKAKPVESDAKEDEQNKDESDQDESENADG